MDEIGDFGRQFSMEDRLDMTKGIFKLFDHWGLKTGEMMALMGIDGKVRHFSRFRFNKPFPNDPATMRRAEYLLRIDEALRTSYPINPAVGKQWLRRSSRKFKHRSPLSMMINDGERGLKYVLCRLDCTYAWDQSGSQAQQG